MKLLVLRNSAGNIQSVAVPNPELPGKLQLEVEGGPTARELEVDEREIRREDLLGQKGANAQGRALQKLREVM
jgi:hypothetical protein